MWAGEELVDAELGDERRVLRLMRVVESLVEHADQSVPQGCGNLAETRAAYRLWSNGRVDWQAILEPHRRRTAERAASRPLVLVAQDTTEINLSHHPATRGLGYLARAECRGLLVHTCLAMTPEGVPLGVVDQQAWTRPPAELGKRATRKQRPTTAKESRRWLDGLRAVERLGIESPILLVGDRESDMYDLFAAPRAAHVELLVRVCRETRVIDHPLRHQAAAIAAEPACGVVEIVLPRRGRCAERTARFEVRLLSVEWRASGAAGRRDKPTPVRLVLLTECGSTAAKPVRWLLATTLPVADAAEAQRVAGYYARRWLIERFHYVLKSGCSIERLRLARVEHVRRALACFSIVAWRLLWLTTAARQTPDASCEVALEPAERRALEAVARVKYKRPIGAAPPNLAEAVRLIARLGGHLGRKCDGPPGVKTVWRGLSRLADITVGWLAAQAPG